MKHYDYYSGSIYEDYATEDDIIWVAAIGGWLYECETEEEAKKTIREYLGRE